MPKGGRWPSLDESVAPVLFKYDDPIFAPLVVCGHSFPSTWRFMLQNGFSSLKLPKERLADCDACPMVAIGEYLPDCRCCTHLAQIPNFQLGLALKDPRTRDMAMAVISDGYALPEGIEISPAHYLRSTAAYRDDLFGKSHELLCPFMNREHGGCTIYTYRAAICSTYHCGHDHCNVGAGFWEQLTDLAGHVETLISQWAMEKAGMSVKDYMARRNQLASKIDILAKAESSTWPEKARAHLFGNWFGNESLFFETCAEHVIANRTSLWTIACRYPLFEATEYDSAVQALLPKDDTDEPDTDDGGIEMDTSIENAWIKLRKAAASLWRLPPDGATLVLSAHVTIEKNMQNDPLSRFYKKKPFKITLSNPCHEGEPVITFLTANEYRALLHFKIPQTLEPQLYRETALAGLDNVKEFLAESIHCGIILSADG